MRNSDWSSDVCSSDLPMPGGMMVESQSLYSADPLPRPYVLKPINEGSSVGVAIVTADGNYGVPIGRDVAGPWQEFDHLLAEPFIRGRELPTAVLGGEALLVTELRPKSGFYDFAAHNTRPEERRVGKEWGGTS